MVLYRCVTLRWRTPQIIEKWFASGESNVFRLSRDNVNGLPCIILATDRLLSGKDF
jgi:hypothetical protein